MPRRPSPQQTRRPLLNRSIEEQDVMQSTTTSRSEDASTTASSRGTTSSQQFPRPRSNQVNEPSSNHSKPQRRLRIFGALGVGTGSGGYAKQPQTPPSTTPVRNSGATTTTLSSLAKKRSYDTRPIYTGDEYNENDREDMYSLTNTEHGNERALVALPNSVPALPTNQKDSVKKDRKAKKEAAFTTNPAQVTRSGKKSDPPSREELVAAVVVQQANAKQHEKVEPLPTAARPKSVLRKREIVEEKKMELESDVPKTAITITTTTTATSSHPTKANAAVPQTQTLQHHDPIKAMLSRPFGRATLPVHVGRNFVVEVSSAEWDADEERWKYRLLVQQRTKAAAGRGSFTTAYTWRSLADFGWLEQALRWEYHGALLVPLLNVAVGVAAVSATTAVPVEAECLRNWLADLLNGIRGQGEWLYLESCSTTQEVSILQSEAMETFLYRTGPLTQEQLMTFTLFPGWQDHQSRERANESLVQRVWNRSIEQLVPLTELCVGPLPSNHEVSSLYPDDLNSKHLFNPLKAQRRMHQQFRHAVICSSSALASATSLDMIDSFGAETTKNATGQEHTIILMHYLLRNYRETALGALEKLSLLRSAEEALGVAWKRMAIALTNLFAYEKDVESAKLGDLKVKRENMPFRKVQKSHVDDGLRILSRHKVERHEPALKAVKDFLSALLGDLSAVSPAAEAFREARRYIMQQQQYLSGAGSVADTADSYSYYSQASSFRKPDWLPKAQSLLSRGRNDDTDDTQIALFRGRVQRNENALQDALVHCIRHLPLRNARMAWRYWQSEIAQVAELHKAASSLRSKVCIIKEDSVARMMKRHLEEEKEDKLTENLLIQRMLQIGHKEESLEEPPEVTRKRELALNIAKERLGRWDIKLGLAVMEAIGIKDPNIRVEETTRDLRLVRKYAIGLRECLNRCVEAVGGVRAAFLAVEGPTRNLLDARRQFFQQLAQLFSGKIVGEDMNNLPWKMLAANIHRRVGVAPTADPFHWSAVFASEQQSSRTRLTQNSVGGLARECMEAKDKNTIWLLSCMSELLNDYQERVQQVESYVYMECVGIQLERHFSERRAAALSAFEKKTDITTAINVARRKKLPALVEELQRKLDEIGNEVTQTTVREAKELHLESKQLKSDIHDLAVRRLVRARETSTERAVGLMSLWAKEEESSAALELKSLGEAIAALEKHVGEEDLDAVVQGFGAEI